MAASNSRRSHEDFLGESEGSLPPPQDSLPDTGEAMNDFCSMSGNNIYRHHAEPRVELYVLREESFPIPPRYIDVTRGTRTTLDVMLVVGISKETETCQIRGPDTHDSPHWTENLLRGIHGPGSG